MKLKDKVAIITGGARGIGRCFATRFIKEGARVVKQLKSDQSFRSIGCVIEDQMSFFQ